MAKKKKRTASQKTASEERDYVRIATDYARAALKSKKQGRRFKQAAQRFLDDLKRARKRKDRPFTFSAWHANDVCDFIEKLPHVEGVWETPEIVLHPSHVFFLVNLFGFRNHDGGRRFTSALFNVARKNAKSTLAAAIMLYCLCCEDEPGAQVISAATTYDQAAIIFKIAKAMANKTPDLREAFGLECFAKAIARYDIGGTFKALHAKASTQDGLNPSHVSLDEIHAHKTADLLNVLTSAAGARRDPLWLYTTTEGYENPGPWAEIRSFAYQLLDGVFGAEADHFLAVIFAVDEEDKTRGIKADSEFDEKAWHKANPLMDVNPHLLTSIRKESIEARSMPSKMAEFRIKRLNRRSASAAGWINLNKWMECDGEVDLDFLEGQPCTAGLDLSSTTDFTAWRLVWRIDDTWVTWGRRWVPQGAVKQRTIRGTVPYAGWVEAGFLSQTEGDVVDYRVIEAEIRGDLERFNPSLIAFDRWNAQSVVTNLMDDGWEMVEFQQTTKHYHPAMKELERAYLAGRFAHGADPVLQWCASNLVAFTNQDLSMKPSKKKSADKIDDMCALLMALGVGLTDEEGDLSDFFTNAVVG